MYEIGTSPTEDKCVQGFLAGGGRYLWPSWLIRRHRSSREVCTLSTPKMRHLYPALLRTTLFHLDKTDMANKILTLTLHLCKKMQSPNWMLPNFEVKLCFAWYHKPLAISRVMYLAPLGRKSLSLVQTKSQNIKISIFITIAFYGSHLSPMIKMRFHECINKLSV